MEFIKACLNIELTADWSGLALIRFLDGVPVVSWMDRDRMHCEEWHIWLL
jgi:hypothetical protein